MCALDGLVDVQAVRASLGGIGTESRRQERDVASFMSGDLHEAVADPAGKASVLEVGGRVVAETLRIERGLEVLECQSKVQDLDVCGRSAGCQ